MVKRIQKPRKPKKFDYGFNKETKQTMIKISDVI